MHQTELTDIAVIGAGPTGLFFVFQAGMLGMRCAVIDALSEIGGQCTALYPDKPIYDIPAYPKILSKDLILKLTQQNHPFNPVYFLSTSVREIIKDNEGFNLMLSTGKSLRAKCVVIAAGGGEFQPNKPPIEGIEAFEGKSILYSVTNKEVFKNKNVVIAGGGDSALDWSILLANIVKKLYVVHRRDNFKGAAANVQQLKQLAQSGKIELVIPYQLHNLHGENGYLKYVEVIDLDGNVKQLEAQYLLPFFGLKMNISSISKWGLEPRDNHIPVEPSTMQTMRTGIFGIGDIITYPGKLKLILTGFAEAALAAHSCYKTIFPEKIMHFEYSTTKGIPTL